MPVTKARYRPAFSKEEVEVLSAILLEAYLIDVDKSHVNRTYTKEEKLIHHGLIGKINTLRTKIANNALSPAYEVRKYSDPEIAMLEDLGAPEAEIAILTGDETKEQYWERCYKKFQYMFDSCTVPEIEAAYEHMYLNDLMSPEQVTIHEAKDN